MIEIAYSAPPLDRYTITHERHLLEALVRTDRARITMGPLETADVGWGGPGRFKIESFWWDPHGHGAEYDVNQLLVSWQLDLLPQIGYSRDHFVGLRASMMGHTKVDGSGRRADTFTSSGPVKLCDIVNSHGWHLVGLPLQDPFYHFLRPNLQTAKCFRIPHVVPEWIYGSTGRESRCLDVFFLGVVNAYYPFRTLMVERLEGTDHGLQVGIVRTRRFDGRDTPSTQDEHQRWYASSLRHAKITCFDGGVFNYPVMKFTEAMAAGTLVLAPLPRDADILGFRDGVTMVAVTPENWWAKLLYYLDHDRERDEITARARRLIADHWGCEAQVRRIIERLERIVTGEDPDRVDADYDEALRRWEA